ncbi:Putative type II secretion system protein E [Jeotgalicoccus saudimassiliensis]|uniref:Putative type II secretion system protein E n=1 Tax=Jeotgalicoccus saudimassiliensis TaxID=1461582 RepID=A0A078LY35_9STAP|nr:ATPase, T2SS/T4P/T4SS family [Jeotgalicoccus saudimassiliensis]CEA00048.1 Putative type II secretion system protein E [Jeotgalicoccus saudimassiliensis]
MKELAESIIKDAYDSSASDIHITFEKSGGSVKKRVRGKMMYVRTLEPDILKRLINYLKFIAELDINEHKVPQSGRTDFYIGELLCSIRISTLPLSIMKEITVIRLLNTSAEKSSADLFYKDEDYDFLSSYMKLSQGLILFTGPTGSGKSTVMYRLAAGVVKEGSRQIISVEDPVEFDIDGLVQVEINDKAKLTYGPLIRGVLRCDPDIIMFGEIRDRIIAEELLKTSLSGHLVLSTFHSKSALSTLTRLKDYGLYKEEMAESISLIVNQRLIHTAKGSYILYEYMDQEMIKTYLNGGTAAYSTIQDKLLEIYREGALSDEEYNHYKRSFQ